MTSIFEVESNLINFDAKNEEFIFDPKNGCHMIFFKLYSNTGSVL